MAKVKSINHIAFAVKDFNAALENAIEVLGGEMMMEFESIEDRYKGACVRFGDSIMSFISSDDPESFISKHVEKYGNSIQHIGCLLYTSPSPRDLSTSRMPSSA